MSNIQVSQPPDPFNGRHDEPIDENKHNNTMRPIKRHVELSERKFDVNTLPPDMLRVYKHLERQFGEEYALLVMFTMRTAIEMHRAWNMTLLSSNTLQRIKDEFGLRMTWELGVIKIKFRVEDGSYELHFRVPYDYDSEYQDIYYRIVMALIEGQITVHEALLYQCEAKKGLHTAKSGLFLRDFPGRLILYPLQAATCAVIFFNGTWIDAGVSAICGLAAGLFEYLLSWMGGQATILIDVVVGFSTGIIGGLWYEYNGNSVCLSSIFLGTLYWFFYGTAFVIGVLEIIAGDLETGVSRFVAVSIKTFVLSLGASLGLMAASGGGASATWFSSNTNCNDNFLKGQWWRIPLYLLCSVAVLGQYRLPVSQYWRGLIVQLVAYELQYAVFNGIGEYFTLDHLDTASSNIAGASGGVLSACILSWAINMSKQFYIARVLQKEENPTMLGNVIYFFMRSCVKIFSFLKIGRQSDLLKLELEEKLKVQKKELNDPSHPRDRINLPTEDENLVLETIVGGQDINIWAILMPAVYQLVPGSIIAKLWFNAIFPPINVEIVASTILNSEEMCFPDTGQCNTQPYDGISNLKIPQDSTESVFSNLMVISTSLSLGLIFGFAIVRSYSAIVGWLAERFANESEEKIAQRKLRQGMMEGMYTVQPSPEDDPASVHIPTDAEDNVPSDTMNRYLE